MVDSFTPPTAATAAWVESALASLLRAPHISLPQGPVGLRMGPGPIDLFSTKFNNTFTPEATGAVDGKQVDREGLKKSLLALQSHYNPDTVKFNLHDSGPAPHGQGGPDVVRGSFTWTPKNAVEDEVFIEAVVVTQGGAQQMSSLVLNGKQELFVNTDNS